MPDLEPPTAEPSIHAPPTAGLNPSQLAVFDDLLCVSGWRPTAPAALASELAERIEAGTAAAVGRWSERSLWVGKSTLEGVFRCETQFVADRADNSFAMQPAIAAGNVTHRAIQVAHTHPGKTVAEYVASSIKAALSEESFATWWNTVGDAGQSDLITTATSRVTAFLDSWPRLEPGWTPRFEESIQVKVGRVTLSARPDLVLGRPSPKLRQSMFIADFKSGALGDHHLDEARFYALVSTLRHGVPPFRSIVYSLSSGEWTEPDVDEATLTEAADRVVAGVTSIVDVLVSDRSPTLQPGRHCGWCRVAGTCPGPQEWEAAGRPETTRRMPTSVAESPRSDGDPGSEAAEVPSPSGSDPYRID